MKRIFLCFNFIVFLFFQHVNAQTTIVGTAPTGMVNLIANQPVYYGDNYIDFECDGVPDIKVKYVLNIFQISNNPILNKPLKAQIYGDIELIVSDINIYTDSSHLSPTFFNAQDTLQGNYSTTINGQNHVELHSTINNKYVCFCKILPNNTRKNYWLRLYASFGEFGDYFYINETLKQPSNPDTTILTVPLCRGSEYTFPNGQTTTNIQIDTSQVSNLISFGGCDSTVISNIHILQPQVIVNDTVHVCYNSTYIFPDGFTSTYITSNRTHCNNMISSSGCDSLIFRTIIPYESSGLSVKYDTTSICAGKNFIATNGDTIKNVYSNFYHNNFYTNSKGCDSIFTNYVLVIHPTNTNSSVTICKGENYTFPDFFTINNILKDTTHISHFQNYMGCDSIHTTSIIIKKDSINSQTKTLCYNSNFTLQNGVEITNLTHDTVVDILYKNEMGCDSLTYHTTFYILNPIITNSNKSICKHSNFTFPSGKKITNILNPQIDTSVLKSYWQCDSTVITNLSINSVDTSVSQDGLLLQSNETIATYQWFNCTKNLLISSQKNKNFTGFLGETYRVIVKDNKGCVDTSFCHAVNTFSSINHSYYLHIFPNPAYNTVYIDLYKQFYTITAKLKNTTGQTLLYVEKENCSFLQLDVTHLPKGIYFLEVDFDDMIETKKLLVE